MAPPAIAIAIAEDIHADGKIETVLLAVGRAIVRIVRIKGVRNAAEARVEAGYPGFGLRCTERGKGNEKGEREGLHAR